MQVDDFPRISSSISGRDYAPRLDDDAISSISDDCLPRFTVTLVKDTAGFGFNVVGGIDSQHVVGNNSFYVSNVSKDTPADKSGRIRQGDRLISVNGMNVTGMKHDDAVELIRNVPAHYSAQFVFEEQPDITMEPLDECQIPMDFSYRDLKNLRDNRDAESIISNVSSESVLDDVPRTPKKLNNWLDPQSEPLITEAIYASVGVAALCVAGYVCYRFYKRS